MREAEEREDETEEGKGKCVWRAVFLKYFETRNFPFLPAADDDTG